jgi:hypothetical protein
MVPLVLPNLDFTAEFNSKVQDLLMLSMAKGVAACVGDPSSLIGRSLILVWESSPPTPQVVSSPVVILVPVSRGQPSYAVKIFLEIY